jgi:hypothetical protein
LQPIVSAAIARWAEAGTPANVLASMGQAQVSVAELPGAYLGEEAGNRIYLDSDAAGYGWFVDSTPNADGEFTRLGHESQLQALDPRAVDRIDLLTVVEHELGHLAGLDDLDPASVSLMSGQLGTGVRRLPGPAEIDAIFAR